MPKHELIVTPKREERLPDWTAPFVAIVARMKQRGLLDKIAEQLRVPRQGGYSDVDIVVFLLCFLCSNIKSQKEFGRRSAPHKKQIAALADRKKLAAPSSVSRYLGVTEFEYVQPFVDELLLSQAEGKLFRDERTAYRDRSRSISTSVPSSASTSISTSKGVSSTIPKSSSAPLSTSSEQLSHPAKLQLVSTNAVVTNTRIRKGNFLVKSIWTRSISKDAMTPVWGSMMANPYRVWW